jgi:hypothetical protein
MFLFCSLQTARSVRTKWQQILWEQEMEHILSNKRIDQAAEARRLEAKETIKDAIGAFAIIVMLYVGLFIPSL